MCDGVTTWKICLANESAAAGADAVWQSATVLQFERTERAKVAACAPKLGRRFASDAVKHQQVNASGEKQPR